MGAAQGAFGTRHPRNRKRVRGKYNPGPLCIVREWLGGGAKPTRRKYPVPGIGSRFGELTVTGYELGSKGGLRFIIIQCSCGAPEHPVICENLRTGKSKRCNTCAKKAAGHWAKKYHGYADICPDDSHRRRLLGRIS